MSRLDSKPVDDLQLKRIRDLNVAARHLEYSINELCRYYGGGDEMECAHCDPMNI